MSFETYTEGDIRVWYTPDATGIERYESNGEDGFDWYEIDESELEEFHS